MDGICFYHSILSVGYLFHHLKSWFSLIITVVSWRAVSGRGITVQVNLTSYFLDSGTEPARCERPCKVGIRSTSLLWVMPTSRRCVTRHAMPQPTYYSYAFPLRGPGYSGQSWLSVIPRTMGITTPDTLYPGVTRLPGHQRAGFLPWDSTFTTC